MATWHDQERVRGDTVLPQDQWDTWKKKYRTGKKIECLVCLKLTDVVLRPLTCVFEHSCGHVTELPSNIDL
mgnify:CR=1 FL=1